MRDNLSKTDQSNSATPRFILHSDTEIPLCCSIEFTHLKICDFGKQRKLLKREIKLTMSMRSACSSSQNYLVEAFCVLLCPSVSFCVPQTLRPLHGSVPRLPLFYDAVERFAFCGTPPIFLCEYFWPDLVITNRRFFRAVSNLLSPW